MSSGTYRDWFSAKWKCATVLILGLLLSGIALAQNGPAGESAPPDNSSNSSAQNKKDEKSTEPATTKLKIHVTSKGNKPVSNASVYIRFNESGGLFHHDKLAELGLKTSEDGTVKVPPVPQGKILIQVVAKGWHTYGKWYEINQDEQSLEIVLEPPPRWY
jgi:hypothetical protein